MEKWKTQLCIKYTIPSFQENPCIFILFYLSNLFTLIHIHEHSCNTNLKFSNTDQYFIHWPRWRRVIIKLGQHWLIYQLVSHYFSTLNLSLLHYNDVTMGAMASQITSLTIAYLTVYSDADQRKYQDCASLAFTRGIRHLLWETMVLDPVLWILVTSESVMVNLPSDVILWYSRESNLILNVYIYIYSTEVCENIHLKLQPHFQETS